MSTSYERLQRVTLPSGVEPWHRELLAATPADKYTRPSEGLAHSAWLNRPRVNELIDRAFHRHAIVSLTGSPGAGKSVAAAQFIDIQGERGLWYRLGPEDRSPTVVLAGLLRTLREVLPGFRCQAVEALLAKPEAKLDPQTLMGATNTLLHELAASVDEVLYLAFDDFHKLDASSDGGRLLLHMLATLPPGFKCLCVCRYPVAELQAHTRPERLTEVGGAALSLTREETQELCRIFLQTALPGNLCGEIHDKTEGWMRGVLAYAQTLERQLLDEGATFASDPLTGPASAERLGLDGYFEHHVIRQLDPLLRTRLCEICWLDEITPELVNRSLNIDDAGTLLARLVDLGLFLKPVSGTHCEYRLHALFRDFLRRRARRALPEDRPTSILRNAAGHMVDCERYETALDYLLYAADYEGAEAVLQNHGMRLLATGQFNRVLERLEKLPINRLAANPRLLLLEGIALMELNPVHALAPLEQARAAFRSARDYDGEMLCLAQQITYHAGVDGAHYQIEPLLKRLERLYEKHRSKLDAFSGVLTDLAFAAGYVLLGNAKRAAGVLDQGLDQAQSLRAPNLEVRVRIIRCHQHLQNGELRSAAGELERLAPYVDRPDVGNMAKALIHALQCYYLTSADLHVSFAYHRHRFQRSMDAALNRQTVTAPLLSRWAGEIAIRAGRYEEAWTEIENGLSLGYAASNPNLRSQFLLYRAFLLAQQGTPAKARQELAEAQRFFDRFGTGAFEAKRLVLMTATYSLCGDERTAREYAEQAVESARQAGAKQVLAGAYAYAAFRALQAEEMAEAETHTRALLELVNEQRFNTYFLFEPHTARAVLSFAARQGIHPATVDTLARHHLAIGFDRAGESIPVLRLEVLGRINLHCMGHNISGNQLSRRERTYIATLAAASHQQIDRETLIEAIWPGGEHTSANVYVVRNRLKKSVQRDAPSIEAAHYFTMTASVVRLENTWIDAASYRRQLEAGLNHWVRGEHWQAECAFQEADALWCGHFAPTVQENDLIRDYRLELQRLTEQKTLVWSSLLSGRGAMREAETVLEDFLRSDPINDEVVKRLFTLRLNANSVSSAERTLTQYRRHLEAEHFSVEEIERTIQGIRASG